jgi:hypothetical protein
LGGSGIKNADSSGGNLNIGANLNSAQSASGSSVDRKIRSSTATRKQRQRRSDPSNRTTTATANTSPAGAIPNNQASPTNVIP